jgi:predicted ATP-grasp superfamily ATP-dependent carboligase
MKILVFEWLVGGGVAGDDTLPLDDPFLIQGAGMYGAILEDCLKLGAEVHSPLDPLRTQAIGNFQILCRHDGFHIAPVDVGRDLKPTLQRLAKETDHIFLIAPECDGILTQCLQWLEGFQPKLVCGPQNLINIFANKHFTQRLLQKQSIAVPLGIPLPSGIFADGRGWALGKFIEAHEALAWPLVVKPPGGAGGEGVQLCHNLEQLETAVATQGNTDEALWAENYIAGLSVSVSIVRNQDETRLLPATEQRFSNLWNQQRPNDSKNSNPEPVGHFVESVYPLQESLQRRAAVLATAVAEAFPDWHGYLGVDMILADNGPDVVVEINPRLTASYETIRAETGFNLMEFLLGGGSNR